MVVVRIQCLCGERSQWSNGTTDGSSMRVVEGVGEGDTGSDERARGIAEILATGDAVDRLVLTGWW